MLKVLERLVLNLMDQMTKHTSHYLTGLICINPPLLHFCIHGIKDNIAVATNSRSMIFVTIVSCVLWCVCVFDPIYSGASLRLWVYVRRISRGLKRRKRTQCYDVFSFLKPKQ